MTKPNISSADSSFRYTHILSLALSLSESLALDPSRSYSSENECKRDHNLYTQNTLVLRIEFVYIVFVCMHDSSTQSWTEKKPLCLLWRKEEKKRLTSGQNEIIQAKKGRTRKKSTKIAKKIRLWITWLLFLRLVHWVYAVLVSASVSVSRFLCICVCVCVGILHNCEGDRCFTK